MTKLTKRMSSMMLESIDLQNGKHRSAAVQEVMVKLVSSEPHVKSFDQRRLFGILAVVCWLPHKTVELDRSDEAFRLMPAMSAGTKWVSLAPIVRKRRGHSVLRARSELLTSKSKYELWFISGEHSKA